MRSEFEKNLIHKQVIDHVRFSEKSNQYLPIDALSGVDRGCADVVNVSWISYQYQQSKIDELNCDINVQKEQLNKLDRVIDGYAIEVDELQCEVKRINLWYSNVKLQLENKEIDSAIDAKKIDELQKENSALVHVVKSRDIQLENEKHEYDELVKKLVDSGMKNAELQKRLDAALKLIESWNKTEFDETTYWTEGYEEGCYHCAAQLEQALKGEK